MSLTSPPPAPPSAPRSSPPPPPGSPSPRRPTRGPQRDLRIWWLVGGAAVIIALIVAGGSLFSRVDREGTSFKYGWPFVLMGLAIGLLVGVIIVFSARQAGFRSTRTETGAIVVLCAALGALLGLALAPPKVDAEDVSPLTEEQQQQREQEYGDLPESTKAGPIDRDGDGQPDLDENGDPIIGLDTDGDGVYDTILVPCPPDSPTPQLPADDDGGIRVAYRFAVAPRTIVPPDRRVIDNECDGTVDEIIEFDDQLLTPPGGDSAQGGDTEPVPELPATPDTIAPEERQSRADNLSAPSLEGILQAVLIGLGVILLVGLIGFLVVRMKRSEQDESDVDDKAGDGLPAPPPPPPMSNANFKRSLDELINDPDPRNGILAAYGHLLVGFDQIGLGRLPHEGPQEHLDRALAASSADPKAAKELTAWFAMARFSDHPITEDDRRRAVDALRRVTSSIGSRPSAPANAGTAR